MPNNMPRNRYLQYKALASVLRRRIRDKKAERTDWASRGRSQVRLRDWLSVCVFVMFVASGGACAAMLVADLTAERFRG
jgi:hypothetical protein